MEIYKNLTGLSNVSSYQTGPEFILVEFKDGSKYNYTYMSAGASNIEKMKELANIGEGLNSFINTQVRKLYASKL